MLPEKQPIPSALLNLALCTTRTSDEGEYRWYDGEIAPEMVFAWEPDLPHARELCVVVRLSDPLDPLVVKHARGTAIISQGSETLIWTRSIDQPEALAVWNEESRFREAAVPTLYRFPPTLTPRA